MWLVALLAHVENKGLVRHVIEEFVFELRCLKQSDHLAFGSEDIGFQTPIPHLLRKGAWIPKTWPGTFIGPGLSTTYRYVTSVPIEASFVLLHGSFTFGQARFVHTEDSLVIVPESVNAS